MQDVDNMNHGVEAHEGCHIYGWMDVQRVAGNLHISVHVDDYMMLAQVRARAHDQLAAIKLIRPALRRLRLPCRHRWRSKSSCSSSRIRRRMAWDSSRQAPVYVARFGLTSLALMCWRHWLTLPSCAVPQ